MEGLKEESKEVETSSSSFDSFPLLSAVVQLSRTGVLVLVERAGVELHHWESGRTGGTRVEAGAAEEVLRCLHMGW